MSFANKCFSYIVIFSLLFLCVLGVNAWEWNGDVISGAHCEEQLVALTFDDGPHPKLTPEILDILAEYNIHATFFAIGKNIEQYPCIIQRIIDSGHEIANHTYSHKYLTKCPDIDTKREIEAFDDLMLEEFEYKPKLIRPPGGLYNESICDYCIELGYSVILWSQDTRDWAHTSPGDITDNVIKNIKSGDIILMHDYISGISPTPDALRLLIPRLLEMGYEFVTVSQLTERTESK